MTGDRPHRTDLVARCRDVLAQDVHQCGDRAAEEESDRDQWGEDGGRVRQQHMCCRLAIEAMRSASLTQSTTMGRGFTVMHDGIGGDDDPLPRAVCSPAEVQIVTEERQGRIESAQALPGVAAHEHPCRADCHDIAHAIVLALIVLPTLESGEATSGSGDGEPDLQEQSTVVPAQHLRADDAGTRMRICSEQQCIEAARIGGTVVMEQPQPLDDRSVREAALGSQHHAVDVLQALGRGRAETGARGKFEDALLTERGEQSRGTGIG